MAGAADEFMEMARKAGLSVTSHGVNMEALETSTTGTLMPQAIKAGYVPFEEMAVMLAEASEAEFQAQVIALAQAHGWRVGHCRKVLVTMGDRKHYETPMAADGKGFPDLVLVKITTANLQWRGHRLIFAELKTNTGTIRPEQKEWLADLDDAGDHLTCVWRPRDFAEIARILQGN